jgi:hypothetical protein
VRFLVVPIAAATFPKKIAQGGECFRFSRIVLFSQ